MKKILIQIVKWYQKILSPDHSFWAKSMNKPPYCKHIPSCSEYMIESIKKKGVIIGVPKGVFRILRCMPFLKGGYDPVEPDEPKKTGKLRKTISKHKKITIYICTILLLYMSLILGAKKLETIMTFPVAFINFENTIGEVGLNIDFEEINVTSSNGYNINGIYKKALPGSYEIGTSPKTIYYFHGNGGPLSYFYNEIEYISSLGYNVITYDYPGYGKSGGLPYKENIEIFSHDFYEYLKKQKFLKDNELIVWGFSIGTAGAVNFANNNDFEKLVLISPLSSRYDMSRKLFGFALQKILFLNNSFVSEDLVKNFTKPVLIIHGNNDKIISFNQGLKVYNNYGRVYFDNSLGDIINKNFIEIDNFGHNFIISKYGEVLKEQFSTFLKNGTLEQKEFLLDQKKIKELKEQLKEINFLKKIDFKNDISLTKFVNNKVSFNSLNHIPKNLEYISSDYIFDTKSNGQLINKANAALQNLAKDFFLEFDKKLVIVSSYRSYAYQKGIKDRGCPDNLCAKAGFSEHQTGLAIDIFSASTAYEWDINVIYQKYYAWFKENAHKYGFHNTYQKGLQIDGYEIEPWHWRYLGTDLAKYLKNEGITLAEFYDRM